MKACDTFCEEVVTSYCSAEKQHPSTLAFLLAALLTTAKMNGFISLFASHRSWWSIPEVRDENEQAGALPSC